MNLNKIQTAYFIGIKGVGMTALAQIFKARGIKVTGNPFCANNRHEWGQNHKVVWRFGFCH